MTKWLILKNHQAFGSSVLIPFNTFAKKHEHRSLLYSSKVHMAVGIERLGKKTVFCASGAKVWRAVRRERGHEEACGSLFWDPARWMERHDTSGVQRLVVNSFSFNQ